MGSSESVTIESDTGRLSEEEIERMLEEAERFAEEDRMATEKIQARNGLESYAYSLRGQLDDPEKLGDQLDETRSRSSTTPSPSPSSSSRRTPTPTPKSSRRPRRPSRPSLSPSLASCTKAEPPARTRTLMILTTMRSCKSKAKKKKKKS